MFRCKHDFLPDQCAECRPAPEGIPERVFITTAGQVFHRIARCRGLLDGQSKARRRGYITRDATQVPLNHALAHGLASCMVCLASPPQREVVTVGSRSSSDHSGHVPPDRRNGSELPFADGADFTRIAIEKVKLSPMSTAVSRISSASASVSMKHSH